jgi:hypothetical protein
MSALNPVMFAIPGGLNNDAGPGNDGFDSPGGDTKPIMSKNTIPPVVWMFVLLIGGYIGLRWVMED